MKKLSWHRRLYYKYHTNILGGGEYTLPRDTCSYFWRWMGIVFLMIPVAVAMLMFATRSVLAVHRTFTGTGSVSDAIVTVMVAIIFLLILVVIWEISPLKTKFKQKYCKPIEWK